MVPGTAFLTGSHPADPPPPPHEGHMPLPHARASAQKMEKRPRPRPAHVRSFDVLIARPASGPCPVRVRSRSPPCVVGMIGTCADEVFPIAVLSKKKPRI
eukprot:gene10826-biopygen10857